MEKVLDHQGRWRNKVVAFRMSPEEDEVLEVKVRLSGLSKQDYIISRLLDKEIVVVGNPKVFKGLKKQMGLILEELKRIEAGQIMDEDLLDIIRMITIIMDGMNHEG